MLLEAGQEVYLKDPDIFCVSLIGRVLNVDHNYVTVKTAVKIKGQNIFTVQRNKIYLDEKQLKNAPNPEMAEAMDKMKQVFKDMAR